MHVNDTFISPSSMLHAFYFPMCYVYFQNVKGETFDKEKGRGNREGTLSDTVGDWRRGTDCQEFE